MGRLRTGFEYFARIERNAELTAAPVLARSVTMCRYLEKNVVHAQQIFISIIVVTVDRIYIKSHSQTSIILVTLFGFLGKRLRFGRAS